MVRSSIPELRAFFFPSTPPPSNMFCTRVATLRRNSEETLGDCASVVSLGEGEGVCVCVCVCVCVHVCERHRERVSCM